MGMVEGARDSRDSVYFSGIGRRKAGKRVW